MLKKAKQYLIKQAEMLYNAIAAKSTFSLTHLTFRLHLDKFNFISKYRGLNPNYNFKPNEIYLKKTFL